MENFKYSENTPDSIIGKLKEAGSPLANVLEEIKRSPEKNKILTQALASKGQDWGSFLSMEVEGDKATHFGHMIAHWDTPTEKGPKTKDQHQKEAEEFVELLLS